MMNIAASRLFGASLELVDVGGELPDVAEAVVRHSAPRCPSRRTSRTADCCRRSPAPSRRRSATAVRCSSRPPRTCPRRACRASTPTNARISSGLRRASCSRSALGRSGLASAALIAAPLAAAASIGSAACATGHANAAQAARIRIVCHFIVDSPIDAGRLEPAMLDPDWPSVIATCGSLRRGECGARWMEADACGRNPGILESELGVWSRILFIRLQRPTPSRGSRAYADPGVRHGRFSLHFRAIRHARGRSRSISMRPFLGISGQIIACVFVV